VVVVISVRSTNGTFQLYQHGLSLSGAKQLFPAIRQQIPKLAGSER